MRKLNYLTITRSNISFPVNVVSQLLQSPCDNHWDVVIRIFVILREHQAKGCYMKTKVTPRLLDIVMQIEQVHLQIDFQLLGNVYLLVET